MEIEAVQELEIETEKVGPQGYSAYEVAVQNGFEGTEAEWLASLKGADGTDGATGPQGPQGLPGTDGTDGADATINGVSTINIAAGENITLDQEDGTLTINSTGGGTRDYTALTNKPSINNVTLSGNKSLSDLGAGTYDKPASGIPKTDLASDVQASLNKADSALQTHQDISGKQDVLTAGDNITIENNVISAAGNVDIPTLVLSTTPTRNWNGNVLMQPQELLDFFGNRVTEMLTENPKNGLVLIKYENSPKEEIWFCNDAIRTTSDMFRFTILNNAVIQGTVSTLEDYMYSVRGSWNSNIFTCTNITCFRSASYSPTRNEVLTKTNNDSYTPKSDYHPATKKYVDDAVASAGSSVPTITITASQIVSQNPLQISMTAEQQAIIEDANVGTLIIDGSALGVNPAYCQKNQDGSTDILLAAFSFAWNGTSGFSISNTTIFAGRYEKETHMLYIVNTPLLGDTPTADNHLANKKYVDDSIAAAVGSINTVLATLTTPTSGGGE